MKKNSIYDKLKNKDDFIRKKGNILVLRQFKKPDPKIEINSDNIYDLIGYELENNGERKLLELESIERNNLKINSYLIALDSLLGIDKYADDIIKSSRHWGFDNGERIIYRYLSDIIYNIDSISVTEFTNQLISNIFQLKIDYFEFVLRYINLYKSFKLFRLILKKLDWDRLSLTFEECTRLHKDKIRLDIYDRESAVLYACLRISSYDLIPLNEIEFEELVYEIKRMAYYMNPILFSVYSSILFTLKERYDKERHKKRRIKFSTKLKDDEIEWIRLKTLGVIFDEDTTFNQLRAMFHGDFRVLIGNEINLSHKATKRLFRYFINSMQQTKKFKATGIGPSFDIYEWLIEDGESFTSKKYYNAKGKRYESDPRNSEIVDEIIKNIKK